MAYVAVPKDLNKIKSKFALGFTGSQIGHFIAGGAIGVPLFFLTRAPLGNGPAMLILFMCVAPFAFLALYEKDGQPAKRWLLIIMRHKIFPQKRRYKTQNFYTRIDRIARAGEYLEEVGFEQKQQQGTGSATKASTTKRKIS